MPAQVARGVIGDWTSRKHEQHLQNVQGQRQAKGFLKKILCDKSWGTVQSEQQPAKNNDWVANRKLSLGA